MIGSLLKRFGASNAGAGTDFWPQGRILAVLQRQFEQIEPIGEDDGFVLYAIHDRGVNFVIALITAARNEVVEIGFLARFVGFSVDQRAVDHLNGALHLSVVGLEDDGDLYLLAGIETSGSFDEATFVMILEAWRRDLTLVLHTLSGGGSLAAAFPAARLEAARRFAANQAPEAGDGGAVELLKAYLGDSARMSTCGDCGGRGRRGLISRTCGACDGSGFVKARR